MADHRWKVAEKELAHRFDPLQIPFETTEEISPEETIIGQKRALRSIDFGLSIQDPSYNVYLSGTPGTGKRTVIKAVIARLAKTQPTPDDWCFVNNFHDADRPKALNLPAGRGRLFQRDIDQLVAVLKGAFQKAFQSKEYEDQRRLLEEGFTKAAEELNRQAEEEGFAISFSVLGVMMTPLLRGKPLEPEEIKNLDPETRTEIEKKEKEVHERVHRFVQQVRLIREEVNRKLDALNHQVVRFASEDAFEHLQKKYRDLPKVVAHIGSLRQDIVENFTLFLPQPETPLPFNGMDAAPAQALTARYAVNVVVDNSGTEGAPWVEEVNPTYNNLIGRIEKRGRFGTLFTHFTLIKAGSLLQANGGYLLLNMVDLLRNPFSWEALKRAVKNQEVKIEDLGDLYGISATTVLKPDPIPVRLRVVLLGSPLIYPLLRTFDEDFGKLFKVKVDFDLEQDWTDEAPLQYGRFIAWLCRKEGLLHFDRTAVAALLEQAARLVGHQKKLSLQFSPIADLIREASHWARKEGKGAVSRSDLLRAVQEQTYRSNLYEEKIREWIAEGTLMIDVGGTAVGQVNGLSVMDVGDFSFGRPSRITARVFMGQAGIVNIEREAKLSGKTHNKGVLILSGYLGGRYGRENPISLSATLCFEQSYAEVEGDSASAAELAALLSALTEIPLRQGIALTGSMNQHGEIQAIGGVNEKIEGFYDTCKILGLTGEQGVIIPRQNVKHLMLKEEVVETISAGRFHVYAVSTVDEAMEILTGQPAGAFHPDGTYPDGTVNAAVIKHLREMGERLRAAGPEQRIDLPSPPLLVERNGQEEVSRRNLPPEVKPLLPPLGPASEKGDSNSPSRPR
jgi:lon-related putative ATP-dependent protease